MDATPSLLRRPRLRPAWVVAAAVLVTALGLGGRLAYREYQGRHYLRAAEEARGRGDVAAEHEYLLACLSTGGGDSDTYLQAARASRRLGDFDEAGRFLKQYEAARGPTPELTLERLLLAVQSGTVSIDDPLIPDYVSQAPPGQAGVPELIELVAEGFLARYSLTKAGAALTLWAERDPSNAKPLILRGWVLEQLPPRNPQLAIPDYQRAVELEPENRVARLRLAEALVSTRQAAEALPHLEALRRQRPDDPLVLLNLALCRHDLGDLKQAREAADAALTPERVAQVEELAAAVRVAKPAPAEVAAAGWYKDLLAEAPYANRDDPDYVVKLFVRSLAERATLAADDDGERYLREAVKLDPFDHSAVYQLTLLLERRGLDQAAKPWRARLNEIEGYSERLYAATERVVRSPHDPEPRCEAAEVALRRGRLEYARQWIDSALREDPNCARAHRLLAEYDKLVRAGRLEAPGAGQPAPGGAKAASAPWPR